MTIKKIPFTLIFLFFCFWTTIFAAHQQSIMSSTQRPELQALLRKLQEQDQTTVRIESLTDPIEKRLAKIATVMENARRELFIADLYIELSQVALEEPNLFNPILNFIYTKNLHVFKSLITLFTQNQKYKK